MFGNLDLGNLQGMMEEVQKKAQEMQAKTANERYEGKSGGGLISAVLSGNGELVDLNIDDSLLEDKEALQILLMSAVNEALSKMEEGKRKSALEMMGGFNPFASQG